jgi:predicted nuclease of predicted toxin-antitoxin system
VKLLLDQNLSPRLTGLLADIYQECILAREKPWLFDIARPIQ